jgi:hypothetical protein
MWDRRGQELLLSLHPEGVRFLREQWSWLRELVRWQLEDCSTDPLAGLTSLPVPTGPIDRRLGYVVDYWCGIEERGPVRRVWEGWVLHDLERALSRVLSTLPRHGGVVTLPGRRHPATVEWACMLETLYVVLDSSVRVTTPDHPERAGPPRPSGADAENCRSSLRWLDLVLDTLVPAERTTQARAAH